MNILVLLFFELDKVAKEFCKSKGGDLSHQVLIHVILQHVAKNLGTSKFAIMGEQSLELAKQ